MPKAMRYLGPNEPRGRETLEQFYDDERQKRISQFNLAEDYYDGNHPKSLIVSDNDLYDDNVVVNITKQAVDRILSFLFPAMPTFQYTNDNEYESEEEQELRNAWVENGGPVLLNKIASNGAKSGHCFVRIRPPNRTHKYPRLQNIPPGMIVPFWKADDIDLVLWYEMKWTTGDDEYLVDFINEADFPVGDEPERWRIIQYIKRRGSNEWEVDREEIWPYPFGPIVDWQHLPDANRYYGRPETTEDQIKLQQSVNKIASDINRILRFHAFPRTIGTGINAGDVKATSIDNFFATPNEKANIYNLEMKSDLASSMNMLQFLNDAYLAQARVVIMKGTVKDFQRVTNTGIRAVFLDMISKNQVLRWSYGMGLQEISRRMMMLMDYDYELRPDIIWTDPLPEDDTEAINTLVLELIHNLVSPQTASAKRGYIWSEEADRMQQASELVFLQPKVPTAQGQGAPIQTDKNIAEMD